MILAGRRRGPTDGPTTRLTFVHGFTQTSRSWDPVVDDLSRDHECICLDAPGHGDSHDGARSLWQCADDIAESSTGGVLVGYSMGARMALHAVLARPYLFGGLILVSGTAGIENEGERSTRRDADNALADRIETIGVSDFIDEWLSNPMFAGLSPAMAMKPDRLRNDASGLADSLRHAGTGTQESLWDRLGELAIPVLIVTGTLDAKFSEIGRRMASMMNHSTLVSVEGAGHTVHLERTAEFVSLVRAWLVDYASAIARPTA